MFPLDSETFLQRVSLALNNPIQSRCRELADLFERASTKDLQPLFPLLIDKIFGPQGTPTWELHTTMVNQKPHDFQVLQNFLSPMGPLFKVIYTLIKDPMIKYDFSITYLPMKIRQLLDAGSIHPFYSDLVHISPQNRQIVSLVLNPFDYYMFHFAYHLINPWHQRNDISLGPAWNTVYYVLCYDYMFHFFPTEPIPVLPPVGVGGKLTTVQQPTFSQQLSSPNPLPSKLLKKDFFNDLMGEYTHLHPPLNKHPRAEIWRSESVLTIFLDMWLNNDQFSHTNESFNMNFSTKRLPFHFNEVPTGEYVRIVRDLVKRLHAFAASAKIDDGHMAELKRITLPIMQGKMYVFLRNLIHRWPLDGSFRLVLELWLSFIQPWRYATLSRQQQPQTSSETNLNSDDIHFSASKSVDREYLPFIAENILAYVVIFQQLLPRFLRVDLWSPKNSLMLYRLAKVFDQPNLVPLIKEIESCIEENNIGQDHMYSYNSFNASMPPLSPTSNWSTNRSHLPLSISRLNYSGNSTGCDTHEKQRVIGNKYAMIIRQKIQELEGPGFQYKPLFISHPAPEVYELLKHIHRSKVTALDTLNQRNSEYERQTSGIFGFLKSMFINSTEDEFTIEDRRKVPGYLTFASQYLCDMFGIQENLINETVLSDSVREASKSQDDNAIPLLLTPEKVRQRIYSMKYEGDPELMSIRSDEVTILVRMFYDLASKINQEFGEQICKLYENPTFLGRLSRQIISPPITTFRYDKSHFGQPRRVAERLPPRISLRYFASYQFLVYISVGILISVFMRFSISKFLFCIFAFWFCIICIKAIFDKSEIQQYPHPNPVSNFSFDNSF